METLGTKRFAMLTPYEREAIADSLKHDTKGNVGMLPFIEFRIIQHLLDCEVCGCKIQEKDIRKRMQLRQWDDLWNH